MVSIMQQDFYSNTMKWQFPWQTVLSVLLVAVETASNVVAQYRGAHIQRMDHSGKQTMHKYFPFSHSKFEIF